MQKNIEIKGFEDKKTSSGKPFTKFETNEGFINVFDTKVIDELKNGNKIYSVELIEKNGYKNILKIYSSDPKVMSLEEFKGKKKEDKKESSENNIRSGVAYRYAVDLACHGKISIGEISKMARELYRGMDILSNQMKGKEDKD